METLVTMVIAFLILGVIYGSYQGVFGTTRESKELFSHYQTANLLLRKMSEEIASSFISSGLPFQGEREELIFFTSKSSANSDLSKINYFLRPDNKEEKILIRRETIPFSAVPGRPFSLTPLKGISFRYFDGKEWLSQWDSETKLPKSVSIELNLDEEFPSFSTLIPLDKRG